MLKAYHTDHGHELAVTWLFSLYNQQTGRDKGNGRGAGEGAQEGTQEASSQGESGAGASEKRAAAASGVTKPEGQVEEEEGQQGAAAMEVDGLGGNS